MCFNNYCVNAELELRASSRDGRANSRFSPRKRSVGAELDTQHGTRWVWTSGLFAAVKPASRRGTHAAGIGWLTRGW